MEENIFLDELIGVNFDCCIFSNSEITKILSSFLDFSDCIKSSLIQIIKK